MYQWKTPSIIHVASILPGKKLSISQLIRIERNRGSADHSPQNEQFQAAQFHAVPDTFLETFSQDDGNFPRGGPSTGSAKRRTDSTTVQRPVGGCPRGLAHTAFNPRSALCRISHFECYESTGKIHRRHASQSAGQLRTIFKEASKKPSAPQTGLSPPKLPQLAPNKLPTGFKAPVKSVKRADGAFREVELGQSTRAWPMSSEERKAEAKRKEEARLLREAQEKKAREAEEEAIRREREEQLRHEAEAIRGAEALKRELEQKKLREKWIMRLSESTTRLERVTREIDNIRTRIEKLLDQCEVARRELWEEKAKIVQATFNKIMEEKERSSSLVAKYSYSSTLLCTAIGEFCVAVGRAVHGERLTTLVNDLTTFDRNDFLPRYMFAQGDTPNRTRRLCAIFWMYERLKSFEVEMTSEAHVWRHLRAARITHALSPEAFAYKPLYADWYRTTQRFVNGTSVFQADYDFWNHHTELVKPPVSNRQQRGPDVTAQTTRRNDLVVFLKTGATDISRELSRLFDYGNFDLGHVITSFKRQQQIALRNPFTRVLQNFRETEQLLLHLLFLLRNTDTRRGKTEKFFEAMKEEFNSAANIVRFYLRELDILTYWNWHATQRDVPQKRLSYWRTSQPIVAEADPVNDGSPSTFHQIRGPDQTWRYTDFRGPDGQQVIVDYCVTDHFTERTAKRFTKKKVIGIDLWGGRRFANIEDAVREGNSPKRCVPMLAIASEERIALFHIASMYFANYTPRVPTLVQILEDPAICKVGENTQAFRQRLLTYMGINMTGTFDLNSVSSQPLRASQDDRIISHYPSPAMFLGPSAVYPPEPFTVMTLSDELKKHFGQSLYDERVNCEELQISRIPSPQLMQLSASRPYAALQLHHILKQRITTASQQPQAAQVRSRQSNTAESNLSLKPAKHTEFTTFTDIEHTAPVLSDSHHQRVGNLGSVVAEHDLGPTNIDPWLNEHSRDSRLEKIATAIAKIIQGEITGASPVSHTAAYVLLTRFSQSCEDIYRILHIQEPAEAILNLVKATDLPLNEAVSTLLEAEKENLQASSPSRRAIKWVKKIIADAPVLLRMYRRSPQTRMEFEAYAMWHRLEMSVTDIAQISQQPRGKISRFIRKTLKLGNPPVFPCQRARFLSFLREYAPKEYAKELERTTDEVSLPSAPWGATRDVILMTGLESFDEGDVVRYTYGADDAMSSLAFGCNKQSKPLEIAKPVRAVKAANTSKIFKISKEPKTAKAAMLKITPASRRKVISLGEASRSRKKTGQVSTLESGSAVRQRPAKPSQDPPRSLKETVVKSTSSRKVAPPKRRTLLGKDTGSNKKRKPGDSTSLQGMTVRKRTVESDIDAGTMKERATQPKVSQSTRGGGRRRRAAKLLPPKPRGSKAKAGTRKEKSSSHQRQSFIHTNNIDKLLRQSPETDIPIKRVKSESKLYSNVAKIESSEKQSSKPNLCFPMNKAP